MFHVATVAGFFVQSGLGSDYDHNLARRLFFYASATYCCGTDRVTNWDCSACQNVPGFSQISQVYGPVKHARALIGFDHVLNARIVAFEGTHADIHTVIDDMNLVPTTCYADVCPACTCHPGFLESYNEVAADVSAAVSILSPGKLIITGHSLGASQATHCAYDLHTKGLTPDHIYTYGQPRVGNEGFSTFYDSLKFDHWRVTHHRDPVTHLPWRGIGTYRHILREAYYQNESAGQATRICSAVDSEDPLCTGQFNDELTVLHVMDHMTYMGYNMLTDWFQCALKSPVVV